MDDYIYTMGMPCLKAKRHEILRAFLLNAESEKKTSFKKYRFIGDPECFYKGF